MAKPEKDFHYTPVSKELDLIKLNDNNDTDKDEVPSVSYFKLFRFASKTDVVSIIVSLVLSLIAGTSSAINTVLFSTLMQYMVNYGFELTTGKPNGDILMQAALDFLIYSIIVGVLLITTSYAATVLINIAAYNQVFRIRQEYLKAAMNQDFEYFDVHQTGDIASKINDDLVKLEDGIGEKLATFVFYQSGFVSCVIMALILGWKLALLCLITFPVTVFLVGLAGWVASKLATKEAIAAGKAGNIAEEVLSSIRTVYAFNGQQKEIQRYQKYLKEIRNINIKKGLFNGLSMGLLYFCIFCSYAVSFWFGYKLLIDEPEIYDVNTMIAVFFGVMMGSQNFGISSTIMEVFGVAQGAGAQIFNLIDNVPTINPLRNEGEMPKSIKGDIELKNVVFHYPSRPDVPVLKGVSLTIKHGQSVALVGHSGCGKSTIIQLLCRYYDVIDGSVGVDGNDIRKLSVRWLRAQIGLVGQEPALFDTSVRENIRYGRKDASDSDIEASAKQANAHDFITKLPQGYDTLVGEHGASLSGGQKQRIAIARALIRNPHVLLLDEATSALDTSSEAKVQRALDKAQEGRTTIVVAHRLSTIRHVDKIYVFKKGEIIESGNHDELMKNKGQYYDMVMIQAAPTGEEKQETHTLKREMSLISEEDQDDKIEIKQKETKEDEDKKPEVSFWKVLALNAPEWRSVGTASFSSLISGFSMPIFAVILGDFIGVLSNPNQEEVMKQIIKYAMIFVGLGIFAGISNFVTVFFYAVGGEYLTERLRILIFQHLLQQDIGFYDDKSNSTGALCARLSGETAKVQGATGQRIGTVVQAIGTFSLALILSLYYEWRVGLVSLTFMPLTIMLIYKEGRMVNAESFGTAKTMEESSKIAVEAVANIRTVASLGREDTFLEEYSAKLLPGLLLAKRTVHWRGLVFGMSRGMLNFIYGVSLYYGGTLVVYHNIHYAIILKSSESLLMGTMTAAEAFAFAPNFQKGINAAGRILLMFKGKSKIVDPTAPILDFKGTGKCNLQNVTFKYPTRPSIKVLNNFNLDIDKGKTIALVGASGCGKSTVIQLLQRYYDPDEGIVSQDNIPLSRLRLSDARQPIGFVQQEPILFDRTIGENIAYGDNSRTATMEEIIAVSKQANIHTFITSLPLGYDTNIGSKGTQLSGGQKQRIAIARALLRRPKILLLDEATSALDTESEKVVQEALDAAKAGRTCVMIAHRLSTVRDADVICVLSEGRVAEAGTHTQLMDLKGLYYKLNSRGYS